MRLSSSSCREAEAIGKNLGLLATTAGINRGRFLSSLNAGRALMRGACGVVARRLVEEEAIQCRYSVTQYSHSIKRWMSLTRHDRTALSILIMGFIILIWVTQSILLQIGISQ